MWGIEWQSKQQSLYGELRPYVCIYVMRKVTAELIDSLIEDLMAPDAFPAADVPMK